MINVIVLWRKITVSSRLLLKTLIWNYSSVSIFYILYLLLCCSYVLLVVIRSVPTHSHSLCSDPNLSVMIRSVSITSDSIRSDPFCSVSISCDHFRSDPIRIQACQYQYNPTLYTPIHSDPFRFVPFDPFPSNQFRYYPIPSDPT